MLLKNTFIIVMTFLSTFILLADEDKSIRYIYEERVNLRSSPDLTSSKVGVAVIGEEIKILRKHSKTEELYGLKAHWFKVEWKGKECYIWGGLFGKLEVKADFDRDGKDELLLSFSRTVIDKYNNIEDSYLSLRLCRTGLLISDLDFGKIEPHYIKITVIQNKGFNPEIPLLKLYSNFQGMGGINRSRLYYWDIDRFKLLTIIEDEYYLSGSKVFKRVFPSDKGGKKNTLRLEGRLTEFEDIESDVLLKDDELVEVKEYLWNGKDFIALKQQ